MANRLKQHDITFAEVYRISFDHYKKVDDKAKRAKLDVLSAKLILRRNFQYNRSTKQWEQTEKRHIKFVFMVKTNPVSYVKTDTVKIHQYPVTILFYDLLGKGIHSSFRWRTGSEKKFLKPKKGASKEERLRITNLNIKNGVQVQFLMELMWILKQYELLFGRLTCENRPPKITNNKLDIFFDKHMYFVSKNILLPLLKNKDFLVKLNQIVKND